MLNKSRKYSIFYEKSRNGWGAYVPELAGLGVAGNTLAEAKRLIREGIDFHLKGIHERAKSKRPKS